MFYKNILINGDYYSHSLYFYIFLVFLLTQSVGKNEMVYSVSFIHQQPAACHVAGHVDGKIRAQLTGIS